MKKESIEYWLELQILNADTDEQLYAGNFDEVVCCSLIGYGNDRFGEEQGMKNYHEILIPELKKLGLEVKNSIKFFENFMCDEYGEVAYSLGEIDYNYFRMKIDPYVDPIKDSDFNLWIKAIKNIRFSDQSYGWPDSKPIDIKIGKVFLVSNKIIRDFIEV